MSDFADFEIPPDTDETIGRLKPPYRDLDDFADEPRRPAREGLPAAFRMRHTPHYVEQLMGDAPLQTVRQIPVEQIDAGDAAPDESELDDLIASIRDVGVLQPLLVAARDGSRFELLAGSDRLSAARQAGLAAVPCLLVHTDRAGAERIRDHARRRAAAATVAPVVDDTEPAAAPSLMQTALAEIGASMRFLSSLAPIARSNDPGPRVSMILNAISVEASRSEAMAAAATLTLRTEPIRATAFDCAAALDPIRSQAALAARVKGIQFTWMQSFGLEATVADARVLATGWSALVHALLAVANESDRLDIAVTTTRVRPAIILEATLRGDARVPDVDRFIDTGGREHPAGPGGAILVASALQSARLHGGRLSVVAADEGLTASLVIPQPLDA